MKCLFTFIDPTTTPPASRHFVGLPPELTSGQNHRTPLTHPRILLIQFEESGIFLYRFTQDGRPAGDTWHQTLEDAKFQAESEYGQSLREWKEIPDDAGDPLSYALTEGGKEGEKDCHDGIGR